MPSVWFLDHHRGAADVRQHPHSRRPHGLRSTLWDRRRGHTALAGWVARVGGLLFLNTFIP